MNSATGQDAFPMRVDRPQPRQRLARADVRRADQPRMTQIKKSSEVAMLFDGLRAHSYNTNNISLRHGNKKYANFMFADGHAEQIGADSLPDGRLRADSDLRSADALAAKNKTFPLWRLDQK